MYFCGWDGKDASWHSEFSFRYDVFMAGMRTPQHKRYDKRI